ncbi:alpha/beta hydrolase [Flavobacterium sp. MXW15]|uniref:Alpha/beta hydrolase n=1 Tax=Xanthomonas chitinilytica TaxID=2989819 RepID=A0ABT3JWB8_9XANT|nr:alpha/beta hydrolase [Xanthomonas sp. H13-6]MCW4455066.1 alpha/beta hydrolase [Flavobacterium sp. MXW15]MCW4472768.1 alpha/beta hydrolase [Xanthomonas sp. H13-6]
MRRPLSLVAGVSAAAYLAVCGFLFVKQRELLYFPQATRIPPEDTGFELPREDGLVLRGWRLTPAAPRALLYFGGNAEDLRGFRDQASVVLPGHTVYLLAYRGYGASDGRPTQPALLADALALYDHVRRQRPEVEIDVIGRSLGSGVASYVASQRRVSRLALVTPFDSVRATAQSHYRWVPVRWLLRDAYPSTDYLPRHAGELMIVRASHDTVVPAANTDSLIAALPRPPQVATIAGSDHNSIANSTDYLALLRQFFAQDPRSP